MSRTYDVVLFGATGFTGRLVAEYLAKAAPAGFKWALAGRNQEKLAQIRSSLGPKGADVPLMSADSSDAKSLEAMAQSTKVVCTTVGPYAKYGLPLVEACAKAGTHSCDLTGETQFMRDSIDRYDAMAKQSGARIVHASGFDSVPSDLGVFTLHEALGPLEQVTLVVERLKGAFSGGTIASLLVGLDEAKADRARRRILTDPYGLSPAREKEPKLGDERDLTTFKYDDFVGGWIAPFFMASVNTRVVRRSNALNDYAWGSKLRYAEVSAMKGPVRAAMMTAGLGAFFAGLMFGPTRKLIESRLPKPGEGPDEETRKRGMVRMRLHAKTEKGERRSLVVEGQGDPGYQLTSLILGESAMCLALDQDKLPKRAGVLTPATAMGATYRDRLVRAGMKFDLN
ncbi:MAG: saccharopine dehydrogenase NADP-binding domain-containing protein [Myxococcaceae bacterium]